MASQQQRVLNSRITTPFQPSYLRDNGRNKVKLLRQFPTALHEQEFSALESCDRPVCAEVEFDGPPSPTVLARAEFLSENCSDRTVQNFCQRLF